MNKHQPATIAVRSGIATETQYQAVVPPIYLSTNYAFEQLGEVPQFDYARSGNPTRATLERCLAEMEAGAGAVVTNSGMSAINLVLSLFGPDDWVVVSHDCYGGSYRLFDTMASKGWVKVKWVDMNNPTEFAQALALAPRLIWLETPSNPLLRVTDIEAVCNQAHKIGALVAVDNTFLSPVFQQPLKWGADFVVHSTTKYINGHSDCVGGVVIAKTAQQVEKLAWWANCIGATGGAFDSYLTLRGLRTLMPRMQLHQQNSEKILAFLQQEPLVRKIYHPALPSHAGHALAQKQHQGMSGMISFELDVTHEKLKVFLASLTLFTLAESLGGVESLIAHPASMTHRAMSATAQQAAGLSATLLRISVGLEDHHDLIADLHNAFNKIRGSYERS